jgi:hypothetical protein
VVGRLRSNNEIRVSGNRWFNNNPGAATGAGQIITGFGTCSDTTGPGDCGPLDINTVVTSGGVINKFNSGAFSSQFRDYICDWLRSTGNGPHLGVTGEPNDLTLSNEGAARTNPSRPYVDVPANILDIGTAPTRLANDIRDLRRRLPRRAPPRPSKRELARGGGEAWLTYQFMIRPIVTDIVKMQRASQMVHRRVQEINRLFHGTGLRRTVATFAGSSSQKSSITVQSVGTLISRVFDIQTTVETRVHCRWKPSTECGLRPSPREIQAWAGRSVYGITIDLSTLWEITPWSWLADWFGDIGTYFKATRNIVPARLTDVCPMTHRRTVYSCDGFASSDTIMTPIRKVRELKSRRIGFLSPLNAHLNFLNGSQMGILAAVGATRL